MGNVDVVYRGFNKFLLKWVLKSNRRVYLPKARKVKF